MDTLEYEVTKIEDSPLDSSDSSRFVANRLPFKKIQLKQFRQVTQKII